MAMDVTVLGTGAPLSDRLATGLVVSAPGGEPLLIDTCGGFELPRALRRAGIPLAAIRHVVVTHRHMDHIGGMPALFLANQPLDLYGLPDALAGVRELMAAGYPEWPIHPEVRNHEIQPGERREIAGYAVEFFLVEHRVPTVAVRVERGGRTLAFSADSVPCDALVACARGADLFLCDGFVVETGRPDVAARSRQLMHPTARQAGEMATAAGTRALTLLHLRRDTDPVALRAEAADYFAGPLSVAEDGETYAV